IKELHQLGTSQMHVVDVLQEIQNYLLKLFFGVVDFARLHVTRIEADWSRLVNLHGKPGGHSYLATVCSRRYSVSVTAASCASYGDQTGYSAPASRPPPACASSAVRNWTARNLSAR